MVTGRPRAISCRLIYLALASVIGCGFYIDGQERSNDVGLSSFVVFSELSPSSFRISHVSVDVIELSKVLSCKSKTFGRRISFLTLSSCVVLCCYFLFLTVVMYFLLILSGDIELNPGPGLGPGPKFPCGICCKPVKSNQKAIQCDGCNKWFHTRCNSISHSDYSMLANCEDKWFCSKCLMTELPIGEVSFCEDSNYDLELGVSPQDIEEDSSIGDCKQGLLVSHLNVRSLVPKFDEFHELLANLSNTGLVMGLSETWLDSSVTDGQLDIAGFRLYRKDRDGRGGGVMVYDDVKSARRRELEREDMEVMWIQVKMKKDRF